MYSILQQQLKSLEALKDFPNKKALVADLNRRIKSLGYQESEAEASIKPEVIELPIVETGINDFKVVLESLDNIKAELSALKHSIDFQISPSIDYEKIKDKKTKNQLLADNWRMEHSLVDTKVFHDFGEELAFRRFCSFAFFQVEEMLNFHYFNKFSHRTTEMKREFVRYGIDEAYLDKVKKVSDVKSWILIKAYNYEFFESNKKPKTWGLDNLRNVRNLEEHRCTILLKDKDLAKLEEEYLLLKATREDVFKVTGVAPKPNGREMFLTQEYFTLKFIRERKFRDVRSELENLYKNVTR